MKRRTFVTAAICTAMGSALTTPLAHAGDQIESDMRFFYEIYVRRKLTRDEVKQVTQDMRDYYETEQLAREAAARFRANGEWLKKTATPYEEEVFRHRLILGNYANERTGKTSRKLLLEPDPPLVTSDRWTGVMLRSDVIAYAQILDFQKGGPPKTKKVSDRKINALAKALNEILKGRTWAPMQYSGLRTTWMAIQSAWGTLTREEKEAARIYALKAFRAPFAEVKTYQKIFGEYGGATRAIEDNTEQFAASTSAILREQMVIDLMLQNFADPHPVVIAQ